MPDVSVVISTLNGQDGLDLCLRSLARQTVAETMEVIVVDDGSTDNSAELARAHGARVIRHETNQGLSAARNSGILAATAPIVAFTDDDCEAEPHWIEHLIAAHGSGVVGVGGEVVPAGPGFVGRYLTRHNPVQAREAEVAHSDAATYRLRQYFLRLWREKKHEGRRPVDSLCGANMSFPRQALLEAGLFDVGFTSAADDLDLCRRLTRLYPKKAFLLEPNARVVHHFTASLGDTLSRARTYGLGDARIFRKSLYPFTLFFYPFVLIALLALGIRRRAFLPLALASPTAMFPASLRRAIRTRSLECLLDPYIQLAQEAWWDLGFAQGLWRFRNLEAEEVEEANSERLVSAEPRRASSR